MTRSLATNRPPLTATGSRGERSTAALSIDTGSAYSATASAASLAAELADLEVTVIDTGVASFPVSLCVWAAGEQLVAGGARDGAGRRES